MSYTSGVGVSYLDRRVSWKRGVTLQKLPTPYVANKEILTLNSSFFNSHKIYKTYATDNSRDQLTAQFVF